MSAEAEPSTKPDDVLFVHSPSEQGDGYRVVRKREGAIEVGEIRTMREGRPIHGEVVKLRQRPEHAQLFDVDVVVPGKKEEPCARVATSSGPPQVATEAYRANWDAIFRVDRGTN